MRKEKTNCVVVVVVIVVAVVVISLISSDTRQTKSYHKQTPRTRKIPALSSSTLGP